MTISKQEIQSLTAQAVVTEVKEQAKEEAKEEVKEEIKSDKLHDMFYHKNLKEKLLGVVRILTA